MASKAEIGVGLSRRHLLAGQSQAQERPAPIRAVVVVCAFGGNSWSEGGEPAKRPRHRTTRSYAGAGSGLWGPPRRLCRYCRSRKESRSCYCRRYVGCSPGGGTERSDLGAVIACTGLALAAGKGG